MFTQDEAEFMAAMTDGTLNEICCQRDKLVSLVQSRYSRSSLSPSQITYGYDKVQKILQGIRTKLKSKYQV